MDLTPTSLAITIALIITVTCTLKVVNWVWLRPKKVEKLLREQGFNGNPYKLLAGDLKEYSVFTKEAKSKCIKLLDDIPSHVQPYLHHIIQKYGKSSFLWLGQNPRLIILDPELVKEILSKPHLFQKIHPDPIIEMVAGGLLIAEDEIWAKHRKIINPAFHLEKLKGMLPAIYQSCSNMINKWEELTSTGGLAEVDIWPYLKDVTGDVISRTAFGSNYEEGRKIFQLQKEQVDLTLQLLHLTILPGWRFIPTKANKRMKEICAELQALLRGIVNRREREMKMGVNNDDLLGILLESNSKEIQEQGIGMSIEQVIEECKLFYFAGSETTSNLLVWTMVLLCIHPDWQTRAREEVCQVFGSDKPSFDGLSHLKIVTMILNEVLRLYSAATLMTRAITKKTRLGNKNLPAGVQFIIPIVQLHYDREIWGEDAKEFRPERFSEGVSNATKKSKFSFLPFGGGARICIGQNFAMIEAKMAMSMILQRFSFELSPSYKHAPFPIMTLQPQYGALLLLLKL